MATAEDAYEIPSRPMRVEGGPVGPRDPGHIERQSDRLDGRLDAIDRTIAELRERLAPILRMDAPGLASGDIERPMMSGLAERISSFADRAERLTETLRDTIDRIDL